MNKPELITLVSIAGFVLFIVGYIVYIWFRDHPSQSGPYIAEELFAVTCTGKNILGDAELAKGYRYARSDEVYTALLQGMRIPGLKGGEYVMYLSPDPPSDNVYPNIYIASPGDFYVNTDIRLPDDSAKGDNGEHTFIAFVIGIKPIKKLNDLRYLVWKNSDSSFTSIVNKNITTPQKTLAWSPTSWNSPNPIKIIEYLNGKELFILQIQTDLDTGVPDMDKIATSLGENGDFRFATSTELFFSVANGLLKDTDNHKCKMVYIDPDLPNNMWTVTEYNMLWDRGTDTCDEGSDCWFDPDGMGTNCAYIGVWGVKSQFPSNADPKISDGTNGYKMFDFNNERKSFYDA